MKSKSPLNAYKYNMTGAYANPQTVIQPILGAEVAKSVIGAASKLGSQLITKEVGSKAAKQALASKTFSDMAKSGQEESNKIKNSKVGGESIFKNDFSSKGMTSAGKPEIGKFSFLTPGENPITLKGSPVKHNTGAAEAGELAARQNNPFARMLKSNNVQQKLDAAKSQPRNSNFLVGGTAGIGQRIDLLKSQQRAAKSQQSSSGIFGIVAQAASQDGPVVGSIGQQMGNQAQQRAADAGGSTGADPFLPPPNQVAETGSYGGGGDRILEMDSNPVGNQSIGRDIDVASQLFGSGQRASMLAMKGTPLYDKGHGAKQAHTHPSKTTTKMKPDGEYPGARYVKGDLVDQDDLLDKTELDAHIATQVQSDKKGTFIKEKSDDGPGSDIETSKGFGKKIRLESMGRSSYTSNMKDQMDPHDFLFKKTPKK